LQRLTLFVRLSPLSKLVIFPSTDSLNLCQSTPFLLHLGVFPNIGWCVVIVLTTVFMGRWSEFSNCSPTDHADFSLVVVVVVVVVIVFHTLTYFRGSAKIRRKYVKLLLRYNMEMRLSCWSFLREF